MVATLLRRALHLHRVLPCPLPFLRRAAALSPSTQPPPPPPTSSPAPPSAAGPLGLPNTRPGMPTRPACNLFDEMAHKDAASYTAMSNRG
uniref:Uncharacterized protein n=1 Tax=Oryza sativa subsp. japonica TaxID=39947 RepID=Q67W54_ORYSJ|nr:hypothetical protein [Oryza sativa Japonica Group]BAD37615.1 hypothetical protein [Oryza sativa Japonica Group]